MQTCFSKPCSTDYALFAGNPFEPKTIVYENQETYHNPYKLNEGMEYEIYSTALPPITEENPAEVKINNDELAALANKWKYDDMLFTCAEAWMAYMNGWEGLSSSSAADEEYSAASRTISEYSFTTETTHCRSESSFSEQSDMSFFEALPEGYPYTYLGSPRKPRRRGFASSFRRKPQSNFGATPTTGGVEVLK